MNVRTQVVMDPGLQRRARARAAELGISFAEYVRRVVAQDLAEARPSADISAVFDLVDEGLPTDIARKKDEMVGEALWDEYTRETGQGRRGSHKPNADQG